MGIFTSLLAFLNGGPGMGIAKRLFPIQSWEIQRRSGKRRFILTQGVLGWGCLMAFVLSTMSWINNSYTLSTRHLVANFLVCPLGGLLFGLRLWNRMEKKYLMDANRKS
jgi:hypothetical protein